MVSTVICLTENSCAIESMISFDVQISNTLDNPRENSKSKVHFHSKKMHLSFKHGSTALFL